MDRRSPEVHTAGDPRELDLSSLPTSSIESKWCVVPVTLLVQSKDDSGRVLAFSMADRATGEFLVIAVLPEYEGKGIGGELMALAEQWLAASGCKRAWLSTDLDTTLRAYGFYRKRGWTDWKIERGNRYMQLSLRG